MTLKEFELHRPRQALDLMYFLPVESSVLEVVQKYRGPVAYEASVLLPPLIEGRQSVYPAVYVSASRSWMWFTDFSG